STVMVAGLGFIVANNNLAAGASGLKSVEGDARLGDALSQLGLDAEPAAGPQKAQGEPTADVIERTGSRCPPGYNKMDSNPALCQRTGKADPLVNLDLQDWFVFRSLPEEWRKNAQVNLWLIFATMIFFVITAIAALYLESAERNVRNFIEAFDYNRRRKDYTRFSGTAP
ncbi:MAG: hypothetical protein HXY22_08795, partial [Alphaproteobacteria bacterium]|nr:hypothetical protein [Alphaproteobacteria bacterium]